MKDKKRPNSSLREGNYYANFYLTRLVLIVWKMMKGACS